MAKSGTKHLIRCRCILPTLKSKKDPPLHSFVVFSETDESGELMEKYVTCNNCGVVHKVTGFCESEIINNFEGTNASLTVDDIKLSLSENVCRILETYNADLCDYEHVKFMIENEVHDFIVLSQEFNDGRKSGKILKYKGKGKFEIEPFSRSEFLQ